MNAIRFSTRNSDATMTVSRPENGECWRSPSRQISAGNSGPSSRPSQPTLAIASSSQDVVTPQPRSRGANPNIAEVT